MSACICGCGEPVVHQHHAVTAQEIRRVVGYKGSRSKRARSDGSKLLRDPRNLVPVAFVCHGAHHSATRKYSVFEFAADVLGPARAFNYLQRRYAGDDSRLDALLADDREAA